MNRENELIKKLKNNMPESFIVNYGELKDAATTTMILSGGEMNRPKSELINESMDVIVDSIIANKEKLNYCESLDQALMAISFDSLKNDNSGLTNLVLSVETDKKGVDCPVLKFNQKGKEIELKVGIITEKDRASVYENIYSSRIGLKSLYADGSAIKEGMSEKISKSFLDSIGNAKIKRLISTLNERSYGNDFAAESIEEKTALMQRVVEKSFAECLFATCFRLKDAPQQENKNDDNLVGALSDDSHRKISRPKIT